MTPPPLSAGRCPPCWTRFPPGTRPGTGADLSRLAAQIGESTLAYGSVPVVLTSVLPAVQAALEAQLPQLRVVDHRVDLPFRTEVEDPAAVGADRYCNMAAAAAAGLDRALVVDVGTAVTFDVLVDGVFLGGLIAPGPGFSLNQLAARAARLGPVPFAPCPLAAGASTRQAMMAGAWHMGLAGIQGCVHGLQQSHGALPVVVTGGLASHFAHQGWFVDPHFTLRGAACLGRLVVPGRESP